ncbi:hypothetical protein XU18_1622 [Perkinsela sp. CCAP 1560/4]|nr:hypothetical protein XU18_1622 [Perkinsela sp. CCAP 1560/4]|eukprot:KNH07731.1 hypothetical protein XU18_1622 [Perkinsela sp. CCAP 1560/4]
MRLAQYLGADVPFFQSPFAGKYSMIAGILFTPSRQRKFLCFIACTCTSAVANWRDGHRLPSSSCSANVKLRSGESVEELLTKASKKPSRFRRATSAYTTMQIMLATNARVLRHDNGRSSASEIPGARSSNSLLISVVSGRLSASPKQRVTSDDCVRVLVQPDH